MEIALAEIGREIAGDLPGYSRIDEIPFDTDRKRMSVLAETPQGRMLSCKGALETVLATCRFIQFDAGLKPVSYTPLDVYNVQDDQHRMTPLHVSAIAGGGQRLGGPFQARPETHRLPLEILRGEHEDTAKHHDRRRHADEQADQTPGRSLQALIHFSHVGKPS